MSTAQSARATERPLRRDAADNLERLLEAATLVVRRDGPGAPLATVAAEAGLGIGTLYRRFATREELLDELTLRSFGLVLANVQRAEASEGSGLACLDRFLDGSIDLRDRLVLPLHGGPGVSSSRSRGVRTRVHRALQRIIERGQHDGSLHADVQARDVVVFGAMLAQPLPGIRDWVPVAQRLKDVYLAGLSHGISTGASGGRGHGPASRS